MKTDTLKLLSDANARRMALWDPKSQLGLAFAGNEMAGECGEACNIIEKIERGYRGLAGGLSVDAAKADLADELADVVICADLAAAKLGIDLAAAVRAKFNKTSRKHGFDVLMPE